METPDPTDFRSVRAVDSDQIRELKFVLTQISSCDL